MIRLRVAGRGRAQRGAAVDELAAELVALGGMGAARPTSFPGAFSSEFARGWRGGAPTRDAARLGVQIVATAVFAVPLALRKVGR